jgi:uncharacterized protein (DUF2235 family)
MRCHTDVQRQPLLELRGTYPPGRLNRTVGISPRFDRPSAPDGAWKTDVMSTKQRLVVCLDGTWNNSDDSTNVLQHFALAVKGLAPDGDGRITQTKHYIEGVGTGVLDSITGGGFGFGLEQNVRKAYDWLVGNYHDGDDLADADEIYIFGFSRGAYTARSLVGFIATCGLVRRGAPLSVNQLWQDYCILGRERENRTSVWDRVFEEAPTSIRRINDLVCDPWNIKRYEAHRALKAADLGGDRNRDRVPGQLIDDLSVTERLLVRWSRRVRITYLGVYDTVGALGIDALAIPGLKSRLAMHHNMRASTLVQHCRHALALDEHRSSFSHTPLVEYLWHGNNDDDRQSTVLKAIEDSAVERRSTAKYWQRQAAMWERKIEQRWFVGAHSNVGGGYPDNELAQRPLQWLLEGGCAAGLACEPFTYVAPPTPPVPVDSYAQFAKPLWTYVIRGKRFYRTIDPDPEIRASRPLEGEPRRAGFSLRSINEQVDDTVFDRVRRVRTYRPPNLVEYARRRRRSVTSDVLREKLDDLVDTPPPHTWLGATVMPYAVLVLWASGAGLGVLAMTELFVPQPGLGPWKTGGIAAVLALVFALVDYCESRTNFSLALGPSNPRRRALLDSVYWTRTIGVLLFVVGVVSAIATLWTIGWNAEGASLEQPWPWIPAPFLAGIGALVATALDKASWDRYKAALLGSGAAVGGAILAVPAIVLLAWMVQHIVTPTFGRHLIPEISPAPAARLAGLLLLHEVGLIYLAIAFKWVGEPMGTANLGSIVPLQRAATPATVTAVLEGWRQLLVNHWSGVDDKVTGPAARALGETVRQALWRDIFGLIPVYVLVLGFGTWYATNVFGLPPFKDSVAAIDQHLGWREFLTLAIVALPMLAAIADYIEDACHLRYLVSYEQQRPIPGWLTGLSFVASTIKGAAFVAAGTLSVVALFLGSYELARLGDSTGWRGSLALLVTLLVGGLITTTLAAIAWERLKKLGGGRSASTRVVDAAAAFVEPAL